MTMVMKKTISAGDFKARCLSLMDQVSSKKTEIVITKRGKAVARLVPVESASRSVLGCMTGTAEVRGDLLAPVVSPDAWQTAE